MVRFLEKGVNPKKMGVLLGIRSFFPLAIKKSEDFDFEVL